MIAALNAARLKLCLAFLALCALIAEHAIRFIQAMIELAQELGPARWRRHK